MREHVDYRDFYSGIRGKRVSFIGAGVSHKELILQFAAAGAVVTLCDKKQLADLGEYGEKLVAQGVRLSLGESYLDGLQGADIILRTPGFEYYTPALQAAIAAGSEVTSEMELFFRCCPCRIYAVTGSDGKTTTTTLISKMLAASGRRVHLGGNIGRALFPIIDTVQPDDVAVVELSSFQLISMRQSPEVAVVTNVTPNHLDHHKDMQEYIDAKRNILLYQSAASRTVLGWENDVTRSMESDVRGSLRWFTRLSPVSEGACLDEENRLCLVHGGVYTPVLAASELLLPGLHNIENVLTAMAAVDGEVDPATMHDVATTFTGVEHRIEPVRTLDGVKWFNDSIASSPTRTIAGLRSSPQKLVLLAGGYDKKISYAPLAPEILAHVRLLILMGPTGPIIEQEVRALPEFAESGLVILRAADMAEAVRLARENTVAGDIVTLSPASASFDAYPNFEVRGRHFKDLVNAL